MQTFKRYHITLTIVSLAVLISLSPVTLHAWGNVGHEFINKQAAYFVPDEMKPLFTKPDNLAFLETHATDPDRRKSVDPNERHGHYINIEVYGSPPYKNMPHNYDNVIAKYGENFVHFYGTLPWRIADYVEKLTTTMREAKSVEDWRGMLLTAAQLGHYVADAHQPLHTTLNASGQLTGNYGIHGRYESELLERYGSYYSQLQEAAPKINIITAPLEFAFQIVIDSNSKVSVILDVDTTLQVQNLSDQDYYNGMHDKLKEFTREQLHVASSALASLWYTAWVNAGRPKLPGLGD